ncbi:hypothetical protein O181_045889 [Austropuccinia psidii MF-1]|uniref:SAC domain-containing protein n=1 Tax=Austropuccinia psidii MF-1 TaxID=1389203 RepID=A0A9Q3DN18_9BASI|nr:hypothetical protein [Austropuccinia psidii MF-1]
MAQDDQPSRKPSLSSKNHFSLPHRITIYATKSALFIKPSRQQAQSKTLIRIEWSYRPVLALIQDTPTIQDELANDPIIQLEFDGLFGIINLFQDSYLVLITSHSTAGIFAEKKIYLVKRVLAVPLTHSAAAEVLNKEIKQRELLNSRVQTAHLIERLNSESDSDEVSIVPEADEDSPKLPNLPNEGFFKTSDISKLNFNRFLWMPKPISRRLSNPPSTSLPMRSRSDSSPKPGETADTLSSRLALDKKFISVLCRQICRSGMYYALDWDITSNFQSKADACSGVDFVNNQDDSFREQDTKLLEPIHKRAQPHFWWNRRMIEPFIKCGLDCLGYVIMQGFVESTTVRLPQDLKGNSNSLDEIIDLKDPPSINFGLISRRSVSRPGFRYQRRGIDLNGSVANFVETEFVLEHHESQNPLFWSFVQIRGSVPLFWSQSPWAIRPPIVLEGTELENYEAIKKHFFYLNKIYGDVLVVCLAEKHGNEGKLVNQFESKVAQLSHESNSLLSEKIIYVGWDFHFECQGMRYENVAKLIHDINDHLKEIGHFSASRIGCRQKGVIRSNCIDCLDRTNVIQSAISRQILNRFILNLDPSIHPQQDDQLDIAFNTIWANNGDQISKQYAGTSALKGDFVRTGRRNWRGIVNDATNSVARMWYNSMSDFFKQAVLDYVLGVNVTSYTQFQENCSTSIDPGELMRLSRVRSTAIDHASQHVLSKKEVKLEGWSFLSPTEVNSIRAIHGLEEQLIILSAKALYIVSYEYVLQKVQEFLRIGLEDILSIQIGTYITAVIDDRDLDPVENYGFLIWYDTTGAIEKKNTYSMRLEQSHPSTIEEVDEKAVVEANGESSGRKLLAFKAPKNLTSRGQIEAEEQAERQPRMSAEDFVREVIAKIEMECNSNQTGSKLKVFEEPIINAEDAMKQSGLLARMTRGVKQMIG